jgi:hypothetical protein
MYDAIDIAGHSRPMALDVNEFRLGVNPLHDTGGRCTDATDDTTDPMSVIDERTAKGTPYEAIRARDHDMH